MKRTVLITLVLAVLAALMGTFVWFYGSTQKKREQPVKDWQSIISPEQEKKLNRITLINPARRLELEFSDELKQWFMKEPVESLIDMIYARPFFDDVKKIRREKIIEVEAEDLKLYQLDQPTAEIIYRFRDDRPEVRLQIGKLNFTNDNFFAKLAGDSTVFLISPKLNNYLFSGLEVWRAKILLMHPISMLASVEIKIEDPALFDELPALLPMKLVPQSQKKGPPQWMIVEPVQEPANVARLEFLFANLQINVAETIIDVPDGDYSRYGLDKPRARIVFEILDGSIEEILIGAVDWEKNAVYTRNSLRPEVLPINMDLYRKLLKPGLRKNMLIEPWEAKTITRIRIEYPRTPGQNFEILHEEEFIYNFDYDPNQKTILQKIYKLIEPFQQFEVNYIYHQPPYPRDQFGLEPARLRLQVYEVDALTLDVAVGDTVSIDYRTYTFLEDLKRNCVVMVPCDIYKTTPWTREEMVTSPDQVEKIRERRKRFKDVKK